MIIEYMVPCPECKTVTKLLCREANPIIFACHGCDSNIVLSSGNIFTISEEFLVDIVSEFSVKDCGSLISTHLSPESQEIINKHKMNQLSNLLQENMDVIDFLKKI